MNRLISVVICTHNRAGLLSDALNSISAQNLDPRLYEVIVVDNNSTDGTRDIVRCHQESGNIRYCLELTLGLSQARNRGWKEATGVYVGYIDDDCRVPQHWLCEAERIIDSLEPAVFGGPYYPFYIHPKPRWFRDSYGASTLGDRSHVLLETEHLSGGNIFFKRDVLSEIGGFDTGYGMRGNHYAYGEEAELVNRIRSKMPKALVYYDTELYVRHLVKPEKWNLKSAAVQRFLAGFYWRRLTQKARTRFNWGILDIMRLIALASMFLCDLPRGLLFRDRTAYPFFQNYVYEHSLNYIAALGDVSQRLIGRIYQQRRPE